jgi:hypothetical protein
MTQRSPNIFSTPRFEGLEQRIMLSAAPAISGDELSSVAQVGRVVANHIPVVVELARSFENPVVIASRRNPRGADPTVIRVSDVQSDQFTIQLVEAANCDGRHAHETLSFLVIEAGTWYTPEGKMIQAGTVDTNATRRAGNQSGWESVQFAESFGAVPIIQTQLQTDNDANVSRDFASTRVTNRGAGGFSVAMEHAEFHTARHATETVGYIAIQGGTGQWDGRQYRALRVGRTTSAWKTVQFKRRINNPNLWGQVSSYNQADPSTLGISRLTRDAVRLRMQEDTSANRETRHGAETVDVLAMQGTGLFELTRPKAPADPAPEPDPDPTPDPDPEPDPTPDPAPAVLDRLVYDGENFDAYISTVEDVGDTGNLVAFTLTFVADESNPTDHPRSFDGVSNDLTGITGNLHQETLGTVTTVTADGLLPTAIDTHFLFAAADMLNVEAPFETYGVTPSDETTMAPPEMAPVVETSFGDRLTGLAYVGGTQPTWEFAYIVTTRGAEISVNFEIAGAVNLEYVRTTFTV